MNGIIENIGEYYTQKLREFGATAKGVDWNSEESQHQRFEKLLSVIDLPGDTFSLLDYGCGFGSMYRYMKATFKNYRYKGFDISPAMISEAKKIIHEDNAFWTEVFPADELFDYAIASGVFNVKLESTDDVWTEYMRTTIHQMNEVSSKGFSFNVLSRYSDPEKRKEYLYYADACYWFDYCKNNFSRKVSLLHDYPLYEFTILVKK